MSVRIISGDALEQLRLLPDESVHCCVTSPPYYGLRDYGCVGQIGLEATPDEYIAALLAVFREVRRVLRPDGTLWVNIGDSYASNNIIGRGAGDGSRVDGRGVPFGPTRKTLAPSQFRAIVPLNLKPKDLIGIPWMLAFALRGDGWYLRQDIIWAKPNPMPESVTDRCTKAHEHLFLLTKSARYWFDADAIKENNIRENGDFARYHERIIAHSPLTGGIGKNADPTGTRNKRSVWTVASEPFPEAHFATFPPALIEPCILAGCPEGGTVLDPFGGAGTTALVADRLGRDAVLIELNPDYAAMAQRRIEDDAGLFASVAAE